MTRWTDRVRRTILPNGLTVLVQRDDSAPAASVITHVKAGFFDEPDHLGGISHVLEHMFFKGTPRRGPGEIARETRAAGGYLNAGTGYDHTSYYVVLPAAALPAAIDIQADALQHSLIDAGELARELQVIIQEARRKLDSPSAVAHETLNQVLFDRHRIRRWRIGEESVLAGFTRDDVYGYYRSRYVPRRTIVAVVGDVEESQVLELVAGAYGDWEDRPGGWDPSPSEPPHREVRTRTLRGDVTRSHLVLGWQAVPPLHPDAPALDLAAAVLGMGRGSRLYRALRETGLATAASAYFYAPTEVGLFGISIESEPGRVPEILDIMGGLVTQLRETGPDPVDLERARTLLLTRWSRRLETTDGRASALAEAEALKHVSYLDEEYEALSAVTARDVRDAVERYLHADGLAGLVYHPEQTGSDLEPGQLEQAFHRRGQLAPLAAEPVRAPARRETARPRQVSRVFHLALPGADILFRRKAGVPAVTLGLFAPRPEAEPPGREGIGALGARAAVRGAGAYDAPGLALAFERLGGALGVVSGADWTGFSTSVLSSRLGEAAALLAQVATYPRLQDQDVERERALMIEEAIRAADDMFRYPMQLALRLGFRDRGYGMPVGGLPETLAAITVQDVRRYQAELMGRRLVFAVVGDLAPQDALEQLAGLFDSLGERPAPARRPHEAWGIEQFQERVVNREKTQTALAMAFPGPDRRDPRRHAAEIWAAIASGLGGRLFESLRSRRSLAYTVLASSWQRGGAGAILTYIAMAPEREAEARQAMLEELARFADEPVTPAELSQAVNYLAGQEQVNLQSSAAVLTDMVESWMIGDGLEEIAHPGERFRSVTAQQVQAVAAECLVAGRRAEGVIRGGARGEEPMARSE